MIQVGPACQNPSATFSTYRIPSLVFYIIGLIRAPIVIATTAAGLLPFGSLKW
jgi:hypothetical protein